MNRRHTIRRKSPMPDYPMLDYPTPATPTFISLELRRVSCSSTHVGRVSLIFKRGVSSSHRTISDIGWPVQRGRTIHFNNTLYNHPSPDIRTNPSNGRIYNYLYNIVHIYGNIKQIFTTLVIFNLTLYQIVLLSCSA